MRWNGNMKKHLWKIIVAVIVVLGAGGFAVYYFFPETVTVDKAATGDVQEIITETGYIEADDTITVYAPVSGKLKEVLPAAEDSVKAGDLMASYEMLSFEEAVKEAEVNKSLSENVYNGALEKNNEYKQTMANAQNAESAYQQQYVGLMEARDVEVYKQQEKQLNNEYSLNALDAQLSILTADLQRATADLESAETEEEKNAAKERIASLDNQVRNNRQSAAGIDPHTFTNEEYARYLALMRQMDLCERLWSQNTEQYNLAKQSVTNEATINQYADAVELAALQEESVKRSMQIAEKGIKADVSGTVIERLADPGAYVEAGTPIYIIQPSKGYKAYVMISRYDIDSVKEGQNATISIGDTEYEGYVNHIAAIATTDSSNKPKVKVTIGFSDKDVAPTIGLEADVKIYTDAKTGVIRVSDKAVYTDDAGDYVYVVNGGRVERKNIVKGSTGGGFSEITEGLAAGEEAIISPVTEDMIGAKCFVKR